MAYIEVSAFKKLRAFFWALQKSSFNLNKLPFKDDAGTEVDKPYCLNLLRTFPDFQGEDFKDDNFLVNHLAKSGNIKQILDQFTQEQQTELTKIFEEKPIEGTAVSKQPAGAGQAEPLPAGEPSTTMADQSTPNLPWSPSVSSAPRRVIRNIPQAKPPLGGRAGGTGAGTAATNKAARLAEGLASDAGIGIKKGLARTGSGLSAMAGGVGRGLGGLLSGAGGGGARFLGRTFLRGGYALSDIGTQMTRSRGIGIPKKVWLFLGGFIMLTFLTGFTAAPGPGGPSPSPGTTPQPPVTAVASCPVPGSTISTPSYQADPVRGHCNPGYPGCRSECRTTGRRAKAIDIRATNKDVVLPTLQGQPVQWTLINPPYQIAANDGGGWGYTFSAVAGGTTWYLDMLHLLRSSTVNPNGTYPSSHVIGRVDSAALQAVSSEPHVHVTIGRSLTIPVSPGSLSTDCDSGWLPSDFMCQ